jgi:lipopolysaccharide export system protein LptA
MTPRPTTLALGLALALAAPAGAQELPLGSHDTSQPIEITADSLEVRQQEQLATFRGQVDAVQGDLVLRADLLRVYYQTGADAGDQGAVRRIEAEGNVHVSSPQETAQGEAGSYDVARGLVTLQGAVVLTRDSNVVRGQRLEIDLASGVARMDAPAGAPREERVRAVFVPGQTGN